MPHADGTQGRGLRTAGPALVRCTVTLVKLDFFAAPGPFTQLTVEQANMIRDLELGPADLCRKDQMLCGPH